MGYDGIIFDFDGVLLDSAKNNFGWADQPAQQKAREFGHEIEGRVDPILFRVDSYENFRKQVEQSRFTMREYLAIEKAIADKKVELVKKGKLELFPGAREIIRDLDMPMSVVSNAYGDAVDSIIPSLDLDQHLEFWTAPRLEEIERYHSIWKPESHMLERAIEAMGASNPVMVGDSGFDIEAAINAGIDSVLVKRDHNSVEIAPDHVVSSLEELRRILSQR